MTCPRFLCSVLDPEEPIGICCILMVQARGARLLLLTGVLGLWAGKGFFFISTSANPMDSAVGTTSYTSLETPSTNKISSLPSAMSPRCWFSSNHQLVFSICCHEDSIVIPTGVDQTDEGFILSCGVTGTFPCDTALCSCNLYVWSVFWVWEGSPQWEGRGHLGMIRVFRWVCVLRGQDKIILEFKKVCTETMTRIFKISL